ncbi:MAG: hypothetical protein A3D92_12565 [Bacteroidetes bacterium RIFCSPHIGHO2_02_FULL_44_7]|nr:MAG: hypothetical protein A3D92_12565 [Bacteroidetes bacterium RIFCSPHIGHO2_02_FULL_44_7]
MKNFTLLASFILAFGSISHAQNSYYASLENLTEAPIFGSSPFQDSLWGFDRASYAVVYRSAPYLVVGGAITGLNSVTVHPCTDQIYVVYKETAVTGRLLGIFDPKTDIITPIGNMGINISSITFHEDGTLFAVSGDGATPSETLFTVDLNTAALTFAATLGNGLDGEVIAYNPDDERIYHFSGNGTVVYESFPASPPYTPITSISGSLGSGETFGAVYMGNNNFLIGTINSDLRIVNTTGTVTPALASTPDDIRGLGNLGRWLNLTGPSSWCPNEVGGTLEAEGGQAYQWTINGTPIAGATDSVYAPAQAGWYNCLITKDTINCTSSPADTAWFGKQIDLYNLPVVSLTPAATAYLCAVGDSIQISASGGGTSQWYMNGTMIPGATTNSYYATGPGVYNMSKTNQNGCTDSSAVSTVVIYAPTGAGITPNGSDTLCDPNSVMIVATAGAQSYQWLENGNPISGETNDSLLVNASGIYSCILSYGTCDDTTATFDLSILDCSGLDELSGELLSLYPNPATNEIHLSLVEFASYRVEIYSTLGTHVKSFKFDGSEQTLNIADLPKGSYVVSVQHDGWAIRRQFVKQ